MAARRLKIDILCPPDGSEGKDDYGQPLNAWPVFKSGVWASKNPVQGNEFFAALTTESKVECKFETGYLPGVDETMRIRCRSEIYEILSVINPKEANMKLLYYCRRLPADAKN